MNTYLFIWKIKRSDIWRALGHMALDRRVLQSSKDISFFKLLGTGTGERFTPRDADSKTWALLVNSDLTLEELNLTKPLRSWRRFALHQESYTLTPIASHGAWGGIEPFTSHQMQGWDGEIAAITRAKIKWHRNLRFWRAVPAVTQTLHDSPGLIRAFGIGEAPIGLQGTFSHWRSGKDLRDFAYKSDSHQRAISLTAELAWYSEELFARFAIIGHQSATLSHGTETH